MYAGHTSPARPEARCALVARSPQAAYEESFGASRCTLGARGPMLLRRQPLDERSSAWRTPGTENHVRCRACETPSAEFCRFGVQKLPGQSQHLRERRGPAMKPKKRMRTKPRGNDVQQEAAQKLVGGNGHFALFVAVRVVLPTERDRLAIEGDQSVIGDGDAMGVPRQVMQQVIGAAEWRFGVDDPLYFSHSGCPGRSRNACPVG